MYVLRIFWGKKHERNTVIDMSTFLAESKHMTPTLITVWFHTSLLLFNQ